MKTTPYDYVMGEAKKVDKWFNLSAFDWDVLIDMEDGSSFYWKNAFLITIPDQEGREWFAVFPEHYEIFIAEGSAVKETSFSFFDE